VHHDELVAVSHGSQQHEILAIWRDVVIRVRRVVDEIDVLEERRTPSDGERGAGLNGRDAEMTVRDIEDPCAVTRPNGAYPPAAVT
jgi:hypothetical protein